MPECTKAERELVEAAVAAPYFIHEGLTQAVAAVLAERRVAEQEIVVDEQEASIGLTVTDWREQEQLMKARIAELEAALAEERAKPKEGAVRFVAEKEHPYDRGAWATLQQTLTWSSGRTKLTVVGCSAESIAREHAAKLQVEHDAKGVTE